MASLGKILEKITYRRLALLIVVVALIPILFPIGLPLPVDQTTINFKKEIDILPKGSVVAFGVQITGAGAVPDAIDYLTDTSRYLAERGLKVLYVGFADVSPSTVQTAIQHSGVETKYGWKYGEDYVITPYLPGDEPAIASFAAGVQTAVAADYFGTSVDKLPLMKGLKTLNDFQLAISYYGSYTYVDMFARQWATKYPSVPWIVIGILPTVAPYYPTLCRGVLDQARGMAEFEVIAGLPGVYAARTDARNTVGFTVVILLVASNIAYYKTFGFRKRAGLGFERAFFGKEEGSKEKGDGG